MSNLVKIILDSIQFAFFVSLATSLILILLETFNPGFVSNYIDINQCIFLSFFLGCIAIFKKSKQSPALKDKY